MTLNFINPSRYFDTDRKAVRFIGHDGMFEVRFSIEADALAKSKAGVAVTSAQEQKYLSEFDRLRPSIQDAARKKYAKGGQDSYTLTTRDF